MGKIPTKLKWKHGKGAKRVTALKTKRKKKQNYTHTQKKGKNIDSSNSNIYETQENPFPSVEFARIRLVSSPKSLVTTQNAL